jgi:hypothetical protein
MTKSQIENARELVEDGFIYECQAEDDDGNEIVGHRFVFVRPHATSTYEAGTISGGGQSLFATYGPYLLPDLNDEVTATAASQWKDR